MPPPLVCSPRAPSLQAELRHLQTERRLPDFTKQTQTPSLAIHETERSAPAPLDPLTSADVYDCVAGDQDLFFGRDDPDSDARLPDAAGCFGFCVVERGVNCDAKTVQIRAAARAD